MTGKDLSEKLNYYGMEHNMRKLALDEKLTAPEKIAMMNKREVCDLVLETYKVVYVEQEEIGLVKNNQMDEYKKLVKPICR